MADDDELTEHDRAAAGDALDAPAVPSLPGAVPAPSLPDAPPVPTLPPAALPAPQPLAASAPPVGSAGAVAAGSVDVPRDGQPDDPVDDSDDDRLLADRLAARNVPVAARRTVDLGLPSAPQERAVVPFERPTLEPMRDASIALVVGRVAFVIAALLLGVAARRTASGAIASADFWRVAIAAAVFAIVGIVSLIHWSSKLADNARRLKARSATPGAIRWSWLIVIGWVLLSSATYLRVSVDGELDPLPGVAAVGWLITMALANGRLQGIFRGLSRTPPLVWVTVFPLDAIAFGLIWWRLTDVPSPVGGRADHLVLSSNIYVGAAAALALSAALYAWLAQKGVNGVYERLGRLEAQARPAGSDPDPAWFRSGLIGRPALAAPVAARTLIGTRQLSTAVAVLHVVWGVTLVAFAVVLTRLAFRYSDLPVFIGEELAILDDDLGLVTLIGGLTGLASLAAIVTHGVWATLAAVNGRRVTVHAPNPGTFVVAFVPMPLLALIGLVVGGRLGYWLVVIGLSIAFFALILVNQMLMALSARLGGRLSGFGRWSACLALTYLAGAVLNLLFAQASAQLGLYATLSLIQGVLIGIGGVVGYRAMRELETTMRDYRQTHRVADVVSPAPPQV